MIGDVDVLQDLKYLCPVGKGDHTETALNRGRMCVRDEFRAAEDTIAGKENFTGLIFFLERADWQNSEEQEGQIEKKCFLSTII